MNATARRPPNHCENMYGAVTKNGALWRQDYIVQTVYPHIYPSEHVLYTGRGGSFIILPDPSIFPQLEPVFAHLLGSRIDRQIRTTFSCGTTSKYYTLQRPIPDNLHVRVRGVLDYYVDPTRLNRNWGVDSD